MSSSISAPENVVGADCEGSNGVGPARGQKRDGGEVAKECKRPRIEEQEERIDNEQGVREIEHDGNQEDGVLIQPAEVVAGGVVGDRIVNDEIVAEEDIADDVVADAVLQPAEIVAGGAVDEEAIDDDESSDEELDEDEVDPVDFKNLLLQQDAQRNRYPEVVMTHQTRHDMLAIGQIGEDRRMKLVKDKKCYICTRENDDAGNGAKGRCEGELGKTAAGIAVRCNKKMHLSCAMAYNPSGFLMQYSSRDECQNKVLCSDHCCRACDMDEMKQRAYHGLIIRCIQCHAGYHRKCVPAGSLVFKVNLDHPEHGSIQLEMTECAEHRDKHDVLQHLPFCECGHRDAKQCSSCPQRFDQGCSNEGDAEEDKCYECATHAVIRQGDVVLVFSETSRRFEMGTVESTARTPEGMARVRLFSTQGLLTVGSNLLVPMNHKYVDLANENERNDWKKQIEESEKKSRFRPMFRKLEKNLRNVSNPEHLGRKKTEEEWSLGCCRGLANPCSDERCTNFALKLECPKNCKNEDKGEEKCNNQNATKSHRHKDMKKTMIANKGYGVIATDKIAKGQFLAVYAGEAITTQEYKKRQEYRQRSKDRQAKHYMMRVNGAFGVDAYRHGNIACMFNHSCDPNAWTENFRVIRKTEEGERCEDLVPCIFAKKDIEKSEEITIDYGWDETGLEFCYCGTVACRYSPGGNVAAP